MTAPAPALAHPIARRLQAGVGGVTDRGELVAALRAFLADERDRLAGFQRAGITGFDFCRLNSQIVDSLARFAFARGLAACSLPAGAPGFGLVALGGYGRNELSLHSDIDILILHDGKAEVALLEELSAQTFTLLWDSGLQLGHSVRGLPDLDAVLREDLVSATALFEARPLHCADALWTPFQSAVRGHAAANWDAFCRAKFEEAAARHKLQGDSPFVTQPNIKESPGGLRDAHTCMWAMMAMQNLWTWKEIAALGPFPVAEIFAAVNCLDFLLRVRNQMHLQAGRKQDSLDGESQVECARALGYVSDSALLDFEMFMRDYYQSAARIHGMYQSALEHWQDRRKHDRSARRQPVNAWLVDIDRRLYLTRDDFVAHPNFPVELMELFAQAAQRNLAVSRAALRGVRQYAGDINDAYRTDKTLAAAFLRILAATGPVAPTLRAMNESGFLGEYLPEFDNLRCLVPHDPYHSYTVDEHILRTIGQLDAIQSGDDPARRDLLREYGRVDLLRLALLLHDLGKGTGGAHDEAGAAMAPQICKRLRLSEADQAHLLFLVREHDLFSTTAELRNWHDAGYLAALRKRVGSRRNWIGLYLSAYCDIKAVGKRVFNKYKEAELEEVFAAVAAQLEGGPAAPQADRPLPEQLRTLITDERDKKELAALLGSVPERYLNEVTAEEAILHIGLMQEYARAGASAVILQQENYADIWVAAQDKPARFSEIAGVLSAHDLNIVSAAAYTRTDGVLLDKFRVLTEINGRFVGRNTWANIKNRIIEVMNGVTTTAEVVKRQAGRLRPTPPKEGVHRPSRVQVSNKISAEYTVVDITTRDRVGLLYTVTKFLAERGLDVHFARIATRGSVVSDVFYVTRNGAKLPVDGLDKQLFDLLEQFEGI